MRLPRIDHVVKTLLAENERIDKTNRVARAHVVVFVTRRQHQLAFQIIGNVDIGRHVNPEHAIGFGNRTARRSAAVRATGARTCTVRRSPGAPASAARSHSARATTATILHSKVERVGAATAPATPTQLGRRNRRTGCEVGRPPLRTRFGSQPRRISCRNPPEAVILLGPVVVVDVVVVVARLTDTNFEKLVERWKHQRSRRQESTTGVAVDTNAIDIDPLEARRELFDTSLFVRQRIIPHIEVPVILIRCRTRGRTTAIAQLHDNKSKLRELLRPTTWTERTNNRFCLRSRVHVRDDRIFFRRIKVERLPHVAENARDTIGRKHFKRFGVTPTRFLQL